MRLIESEESRDSHSPYLKKWEVLLIGLSSLAIFIAQKDSFNMTVAVPIAIPILFGYMYKTKGRFVDKRLLLLCFLILGCCSISMIIALALDNKTISVSSIVRFGYLAFILLWLYIIIDRSYTRRDVKSIFLLNVISGAIISLAIIWRFHEGASGKIAVLNIWGEPVEENYMASLIAFQFVIAVIFFRYTKNLRNKIIIAVLGFIILLGIVLSGSRAALLGSLMGVAVLFLFYVFHNEKKNAVSRVLCIFFVIIGIVAAYFIIESNLPSWYFNRFFQNTYFDSSNTNRIAVWIYGVEHFFERPLFGYGVGNFSYYLDSSGIFFGNGVVVAHNTFLDALLDIGIIGFSLFSILILRYFSGMHHNDVFVSLFVVAAFTAFIVGGERAFFFWNAVILLIILARCLHDNLSANSNQIEKVFDIENGDCAILKSAVPGQSSQTNIVVSR